MFTPATLVSGLEKFKISKPWAFLRPAWAWLFVALQADRSAKGIKY